MAQREVLSLNESIPQILAPQAGDHYFMPRKLELNAGTLTADEKVLDLSATWNNAGVTFTGLKFNVTDTASNAASLLLDLQVGGTSKFLFTKGGVIASPSGSVLNLSADGKIGTASNVVACVTYQSFQVNSSSFFGWGNDTFASATADLQIRRDAAATLAQRNGTNAQTFRLYNTYTDASNYERAFLQWNANVLTLGTEAAGTGTARDLGINAAATKVINLGVGTTTDVVTVSSDRCQFKTTAFFGFNDIRIYRDAANILNLGGSSSTTGSALQMQESTAPASPPTNSVRIYAEDNGSGKTRLMALFATGTAQQIAIEP